VPNFEYQILEVNDEVISGMNGTLLKMRIRYMAIFELFPTVHIPYFYILG
jgi:hypothetical protein